MKRRTNFFPYIRISIIRYPFGFKPTKCRNLNLHSSKHTKQRPRNKTINQQSQPPDPSCAPCWSVWTASGLVAESVNRPTNVFKAFTVVAGLYCTQCSYLFEHAICQFGYSIYPCQPEHLHSKVLCICRSHHIFLHTIQGPYILLFYSLTFAYISLNVRILVLGSQIGRAFHSIRFCLGFAPHHPASKGKPVDLKLPLSLSLPCEYARTKRKCKWQGLVLRLCRDASCEQRSHQWRQDPSSSICSCTCDSMRPTWWASESQDPRA